jgi:GT2 family glycosyltransferase
MTQAPHSPDISVLIVNWRSGEMTRALVENLREQRFTGADGEQGTLEFIVTDNTCDASEEVHLEALEADGVTVIRSRQNSGYAMGMNLAAEKAKGRFILISNPDVLAFRGALAAMKEHLESHEGCGVVGPKGYLDAKRFFQLPPVDLPSLCELFSETLARAFRGRGRCHAEARTRRAIKVWTATDPVSRSMVSGFCMLMRTDLARELGPFDAGYPFYYEDADLCLRLHRRGFTTDLVPRAQMVHFFNRSAGQAQELAWSRYAVSKRRFFRRRYGLPGQLLYDLMNAFTASRKGQGHLFTPIEDLGEQSSVPVVGVPGSGPYLAEISADPGFVFAAGRLDVQRRFTVPVDVWDGLAPAPYYLRFLHRGTWRIERTVKITKVAAPAPRAAEPVAAVTSEA